MSWQYLMLSAVWVASLLFSLDAAAIDTLSDAGSAASRSNRPNILFIMTDDQSPNTIASYGELDWAQTPNIDRLAAEGVRFTRAYGAPSCTVTRAMFLTGLQPHAIETLRVNDHENPYDPSVLRFWPAELRKSGYETALIGKWHLGNDAGHGRDWDHTAIWTQLEMLGPNWYRNPLISIDGGEPEKRSGYATDLYTNYAIDFITKEHDRPWFLWLTYNAPHAPLQPHKRHKDQYADVELQRPLVMAPASDYRYFVAEDVRNYHRLVAAVDEGVGLILSALANTQQLDNTLIVFSSDQGYGFGEHGIVGKIAPYEANMRVPLIVRYPAEVPAGTVIDTPLGILDLPPTFLSYAEVELPWEMHGRNARALLHDPSTAWDHPVLLENFYAAYGADTDTGQMEESKWSNIPWWVSYTQGHYKYIRSLVDGAIEELYDLDADPDELHNLAVQPQFASLLADFRRRTLEELKRTNARFAKNMPEPRMELLQPDPAAAVSNKPGG